MAISKSGGTYPGAPERIWVGEKGLVFGESGRHYPEPGNWSLYTNAPRPFDGFVMKGDVFQIPITFTRFDGVHMGTIYPNFVAGSLWDASIKMPIELFLSIAWFSLHIASISYNHGFATNALSRNSQIWMEAPYSVTSAQEVGERRPLLTSNASAPGSRGLPLRTVAVARLETAKHGLSFRGNLYLPLPDAFRPRGKPPRPLRRDNTVRFLQLLSPIEEVPWPYAPKRTALSLCVRSRALSARHSAIVVNEVTNRYVLTHFGSRRDRQEVDR